MTKVLLHACCAPCTTYVHKWLEENNFQTTALFYNPNIDPFDEHDQRFKSMRFYCSRTKLGLVLISPEEKTIPGNCVDCYERRMARTARTAREEGFDAFSTTLLISPFQKHKLIIKVCEEMADRYKIKFLYNDFRKSYHESRLIAKEMGLYSQKYCGCKVSKPR